MCLTIGLSVARFPHGWVGIFSDDSAVLDAGSLYLRIVAPFYPLFGIGMALYFASQGAGRVVLPVLAGTARLLLVVVAGGMLVLSLGGPLSALFAVIACGLLLFGGLTALVVYKTKWQP